MISIRPHHTLSLPAFMSQPNPHALALFLPPAPSAVGLAHTGLPYYGDGGIWQVAGENVRPRASAIDLDCPPTSCSPRGAGKITDFMLPSIVSYAYAMAFSLSLSLRVCFCVRMTNQTSQCLVYPAKLCLEHFFRVFKFLVIACDVICSG